MRIERISTGTHPLAHPQVTLVPTIKLISSIEKLSDYTYLFCIRTVQLHLTLFFARNHRIKLNEAMKIMRWSKKEEEKA
jgi:hypothetical protein